MRRETPHSFVWLGSGRIPAQFDLTSCGWTLDVRGEASSGCIGILPAGPLEDTAWERLLAVREEDRRFILVITPSRAHERAELLRVGFGEAVAEAIEGGEFAARAGRLAELTGWVPRHRRLGDLELDLVAREAYGHGKSLNLNPREFALIWRLADAPGETVSKHDLIHDVWRMGFVPETNSIAVHMSRLRRKLGFVGLSGIIATSPNGGYCLMRADDVPPAADIAFTAVQPARIAPAQAML